MRRTLILSALVVAGCAGSDPREDTLNFYDRVDFLRAKYNACLDSRDFTEQARIEVSLARETGRRFETIVRDSAQEADLRIRYLATFALGFSKRNEAGPPLVARLDDADPIIRVQAAIGLGQLRLPSPPIEKVIAILDDPALYVRQGALVALRLMLAPGQDAGLTQRLIGLLDDTQLEIRNEAVQLMGRIRKAEFMEPIATRALRDTSLLVRLNGAMALGQFGAAAEAYVPQLIELLKDLEAGVVEAAHWAVKRVTGKDFDRSYHSWRDWYDEERSKFEYFCAAHADVVRPVPGACPTCQVRLEKRLKPNVPKREEKKDDKK